MELAAYENVKIHTVEALVSENPRDAKKVSVSGAGRLRERPLQGLLLCDKTTCYKSIINVTIILGPNLSECSLLPVTR